MVFLMFASAILGFVSPLLILGQFMDAPSHAQLYYVTMLGFVYLTIRRIGKPRPMLWKWIINSHVGCIVTAIAGGAMTSAFSMALGAIPIPEYAHWAIAIVMSVILLLPLMQDGEKSPPKSRV
jgi:hypothetical protein